MASAGSRVVQGAFALSRAGVAQSVL